MSTLVVREKALVVGLLCLVVGLLCLAAFAVCFVLYETNSERSEQQRQVDEQHQALLLHMARLESKLDEFTKMQLALRSDSAQLAQTIAQPAQATAAITQAKRAESTQRAASSPQITEQIHAGRSIVDRAIAAGNWTDDDDMALTRATLDLPSDEQFELRRQVAVAVNEGRLKLHNPF